MSMKNTMMLTTMRLYQEEGQTCARTTKEVTDGDSAWGRDGGNGLAAHAVREGKIRVKLGSSYNTKLEFSGKKIKKTLINLNFRAYIM